MSPNTLFCTLIAEHLMRSQLAGHQWKQLEKCHSTPLTVMAIYSLNSHLSNRSFLTPSISHSITCFLFPLYAVGKLQKYLWVVILVIYLKHLLLHYGMLFIAVTHLSVLITSIFQSLIAFLTLILRSFHKLFFSFYHKYFRILILVLVVWIMVHQRHPW